MSYNSLRKGRFSAANQEYLITFCTHQRAPIFNNFQNARVVVDVVRALHDEQQLRTLAWVIMPDHVHLLSQLGEKLTLSTAVAKLKGESTRRIMPGGMLWQKNYHDRALRWDEDRVAMARYIVRNPLRAGLVRSLRLYPHWDSIYFAGR